MLRLIRGLFRRKATVGIRVDAAEVRLKNLRAIITRAERERWEKRMRELVDRWQASRERGFPGTFQQASIDLDEAIDDLTAKREG